MNTLLQVEREALLQEGVSQAIAVVEVINDGSLLSDLPDDPQAAKRQNNALWLLTMLSDQLRGIQARVDTLGTAPLLCRKADMALLCNAAAPFAGIALLSRRVLAALEPWYDWGIIEVERMQGMTREHSVPGPVRYFDLQWFGLHLSFQIGRTPTEGR